MALEGTPSYLRSTSSARQRGRGHESRRVIPCQNVRDVEAAARKQAVLSRLPTMAAWTGDESDSGSKDEPVRRFKTNRTKLHPQVNHMDCLRAVPLFKECSAGFLEMLAEQVVNKVFDVGSTILQQGDFGDSMYILHKGDVDILVGDVTVASLSAGSVFGEMAAICRDPVAAKRSATVKAKSFCDCRVVGREGLMQTLVRFPEDASIIEGEREKRFADLRSRGMLARKRHARLLGSLSSLGAGIAGAKGGREGRGPPGEEGQRARHSPRLPAPIGGESGGAGAWALARGRGAPHDAISEEAWEREADSSTSFTGSTGTEPASPALLLEAGRTMSRPSPGSRTGAGAATPQLGGTAAAEAAQEEDEAADDEATGPSHPPTAASSGSRRAAAARPEHPTLPPAEPGGGGGPPRPSRSGWRGRRPGAPPGAAPTLPSPGGSTAEACGRSASQPSSSASRCRTTAEHAAAAASSAAARVCSGPAATRELGITVDTARIMRPTASALHRLGLRRLRYSLPLKGWLMREASPTLRRCGRSCAAAEPGAVGSSPAAALGAPTRACPCACTRLSPEAIQCA